MRLKVQKGDFVAIVIVLALTLLTAVVFHASMGNQKGSTLLIYQNGVLIKEFSLAEDVVYELKGDYWNRIEIRDGRAGIRESDCPGADCVHSGWIQQNGRSIVCLPNRVELRIGGTAEVDFVVQ